VRQRGDKQGVLPAGPLRAPPPAPPAAGAVFHPATTSPNLTPSSARRISFKEESLSSLENDFPVK